MKKQDYLKTMAEIAIFAAIGYVLDFLSGVIFAPVFVNGGSIGLAMVAVLIISYRRGLWPGVATGLVIGLLDLADGFFAMPSDKWYLILSQVALDYVVAYPLVGVAGAFSKPYRNAESEGKKTLYLVLGCLIGGLLKFASHYFSGILFWNDPAGFIWGFTNGYLYSFVYNIAYMGPCILVSLAAMLLISKKYPAILDSSVSFARGNKAHGDGEKVVK